MYLFQEWQAKVGSAKDTNYTDFVKYNSYVTEMLNFFVYLCLGLEALT